jgi:hypothetical protein
MNKTWTEAEIDILRQAHNTHTIAEMADELDRPLGSVRLKAKELGITLVPSDCYYTEQEDAIILAHQGTKTTSEIGALIGRPGHGISHRLKRLGVVKIPVRVGRLAYTPEEEAIIRENAGKLTARQIAELLPGRDRQSVKQKAWYLGISLRLDKTNLKDSAKSETGT